MKQLMIRTTFVGVVPLLLLAGCSKPAAPAAEEKKGPDEVAVEVAVVGTRSMNEVVEAQGNLAPAQGASSKVGPVVQGRISKVFVREGDAVSAGQILAIVENRPQQAMALSSKGAISAADALAKEAEIAAKAAAIDQQNSLALAKLSLESAKLDSKNGISQSEISLQSATTDLQKIRAGSRPQEIAQAELAVGLAKATHDRAATETERVKFLYDKGVDSKRQWEDAQTALVLANGALETSKQQLSLLRAGNRPEDIRSAEIRVAQARETLAQTRSTGEAKIAQAEAAVKQSQQSVMQVAVKRQDAIVQRETAQQKRADFQAATATAGYSEVRSPFAGIVSKRNANPGDIADPTNAIIEVIQKSALNMTAFLPAEDSAKVHAGLPVNITSTDVSGQVFSGQVISVGQVDVQSNLLSVRMSVDNSTGKLRSGSYAHADIIVHTVPKAVVVPKEAIVSRDGAALLFTIAEDGKAHKVSVTTGIESAGFVEILKGAAAGQKVIKLGQFEISDGQKVHIGQKVEADKKVDEKNPNADEKSGVKVDEKKPAEAVKK